MLLQLILPALLATIAASQGIESRSVRSPSADRSLPPIHHDADAMRMENMSFLGSGFSLGLWTAFAGPLIASAPEIPKNPFPLKTPERPGPGPRPWPVPPDTFTTFLWGIGFMCNIGMGAYMLWYLYSDFKSYLDKIAKLLKPGSQKPSSEKPSSQKPDSQKPDSEKPDSEKPDSEKPDSAHLLIDSDKKITKPLKPDLRHSVPAVNPETNNENPDPIDPPAPPVTPTREIRLFRLKSPQR